MYLFDISKYQSVWTNFIERSDPASSTDNLTSAEWNSWLENKLIEHNAIDIPDHATNIYFRTEEDALLFIIMFS